MTNNHFSQNPLLRAADARLKRFLLQRRGDKTFHSFVALLFFLSSFLTLSAQPQDYFYRAWTQTGGAVAPGFINRVVTVAGSGTVSYSASSVLISTDTYGMRLIQSTSAGMTGWIANFDLGAGGTTHVGGITLDPSGNILVTGSAYNGSTNGHDLFLVKYNSSGTKLWHQTYSGAGTGTDAGAAVICNSSGDIFVTGVANQSALDVDALTLCYAPNGTLVWDETWDNASLIDAGATLSLLGTRVFVTGATQTNFNTWEYAVIRYEQSNGSFVSATVTSAGGTNIELVSAATLDAAGNVYLTGALGVTGQGFNIKTIKLSPSLDILWTANWNGAANLDDAGRSIAVDTAGNVFVAGYTTATDRNGILLKYSPSGSLLFTRIDTAVGAGEFTGIALSSAQEPFVGGYTAQQGNKDFHALFYTNSGTLIWSDTYNGYGNADDVAQQVTPDGLGNFLLSGTSGESTLTVKYARHSLLLPLDETVNAPFIENRGQVMGTDTTPQDDVRYYTRSNYPNTYIFDDKLSFVFAHIDTVPSSLDTMVRVDLSFVTELTTVAVGLERQEDFHNYYLGHIPEGRERVPLENKVLHPNIYTNIDALYGLGEDGFFARFVCKPGSNPNLIRMLFKGHTGLSVETDGSLRIATDLEDLILAPPTAVFSDEEGTESEAGWEPVFIIVNDSTVRVTVGTVPSGSSVIIKTGRERYDPENECDYYWSTYFGETGREVAIGNDVNNLNGDMYFTGYTTSNMFPTLNAFEDELFGNLDAYAACFRQLDEQKWATFYGGTEVPGAPNGFAGDIGSAIKWNAQNQRVYFVGKTTAGDFPLEQKTGYFNDETKGPVDEWESRGFIVKLIAETGERDWATFFGDEERENDAVTALLVRANGNIVVGGHSFGGNQTNFPFFPNNTPGTSPHIQTHGRLYIAEFSTSNAQVWATKLMNDLIIGGATENVADIAENSGGRLFVVGNINGDENDDFVPLGIGSIPFSGFGSEVFLIDFSQAREIIWSSYLGGSSNEYANSVVCPPGGGIIVTGTTLSYDFPTVALGDPGDPFFNDASLGGFSDIFISEFIDVEFGAKSLLWSRYLGGPGTDNQPSVAVSGTGIGSGNATVVLGTNEIAITGSVADDFSPLTASSCSYYYGEFNRGLNQTGSDACIVIIKNREVTFSTYWGGASPSAISTDDGFTISKGINPNAEAFVLLGGSTNSSKMANQGETIPVCRELPFPGSYYHNNLFGIFQFDAFISKIYYGDCLTSSVTSPGSQTRSLEIQPNPAWDAISITLPETGKGDVGILLFDATGKGISQMSLSASDSTVSIEIETLPPGLYFVTLQSSGRTYNGKFVKM
jgi:hypothetical protein